MVHQFAVLTEQLADGFAARIVGEPGLSARADTSERALADLKSLIESKLAKGELSTLAVHTGFSEFAGAWKDDPDLKEMIDEIYRERDADRDRVIAEYELEESLTKAAQ